MKQRLWLPLVLGLYVLGSSLAAERRNSSPVITDNSPTSFKMTWRNDTGNPSKFGPSTEGLRWECKGTTKLGLDLRFSGAYLPAFNEIKVSRFAPTRPHTQLAQWQLNVSDSLAPGVEHQARGGGVSKDPPSDGLLPGFKTVTFTVTPDPQGSGWTAALTWSN